VSTKRSHEERLEAYETAKSIGNYLGLYFERGQGVRLGDSCVVSLKDHEVAAVVRGHVKVLTNRDAGQVLLDYIDPQMVVNLNVFHGPGIPDPCVVAQKIYSAIEDYITIEIPRLTAAEDEKLEHMTDYAMKLQVSTRGGKGLVWDLISGRVEPIEERQRGGNFVQVLAKLSRDKYGIILPIATAVEEALIESGLELGKVKKISHMVAKQTEKQEGGGSIPIPWKRFKGANFQLMKESQNQLLMKLAERFGSVEDLEDFVESFSTKLFKRTTPKPKGKELEERIQELKEMGLVKDSWFGPVLTKEGKEVREYLINHKCELEAEMRRKIRKSPGRPGSFQKSGSSQQKMSPVEYTNRNKTIRLSSGSWSGDLAVPETVIHAKKKSLMKKERRLRITKDDLYIYRKRSYVPVDICLLIDASGSMVGEKWEAACFLAEHLLLTGKEKVAVVTFQEMRSQVVVPFTRSQQDLIRGLKRIRPVGMTPLADGIITAVDLILSSRPHNPTLVLITDGLPNYPLWSFDAAKDALEAAARIPKKKIRLICIGVEANRGFLEKLADVAQGKLFVVDDLNSANLINIVKHEKRSMNLADRSFAGAH